MKQGSLLKSKLISGREWRACTSNQPLAYAYKSRMTLVHRPCKAPSLILSLLENPGLKLHIYLVRLVTLPVPGGFLPVPCWVLAVTHLITGWDHPQHGDKVWLLGSSLLCSIIILLWNSSTLLLLPLQVLLLCSNYAKYLKLEEWQTSLPLVSVSTLYPHCCHQWSKCYSPHAGRCFSELSQLTLIYLLPCDDVCMHLAIILAQCSNAFGLQLFPYYAQHNRLSPNGYSS